MYIDGYWVWCEEANYHDPAAAAAARSKEQSAVSSSVVYTSIMNNMSSLSRLFRSFPTILQTTFFLFQQTTMSPDLSAFTSKIMPDDIYKKRD